MTEHVSGEHVMHICRGEEGDTEIHVYHDGLCDRPRCPVQYEVDEWLNELIEAWGEGFHVVEFWFVPAAWCGGTMIDAAGGLRSAVWEDDQGRPYWSGPLRGDHDRWLVMTENATDDGEDNSG